MRSSNEKPFDHKFVSEDIVKMQVPRGTFSPFWRKNFGEFRDRPKNFQYRFLAAFSRSEIVYKNKIFKGTDDIFQFFVKNHEELAVLDIDDEFLIGMFPKVFQQLVKLRQILDGDTTLKNRFLFWVVGFDWVGNEKGSPFCPFPHSQFFQVLNRVRNYGWHKKFGFRIHCGENVPRLNSHLIFENHMTIVTKTIDMMVLKLKNNPDFQTLMKDSLTFPGLRIGHGIAFLETSMAQFLENTLRGEQIVCEINMTSNLYLLSHVYHGQRESDRPTVLRKFLDAGVPIILSTDDDGIWSIPKCKSHYYHISVAREFCEAIRIGAIDKPEECTKIINWTHSCIFNRIQNC